MKNTKKPKRKKAIDSQQNKAVLEVLVNAHIPFLETSLHVKQKECDQLSGILYCRDATIARKTTLSLMKDAELERLRTENRQLCVKVNELKQQL